MAGTDHYPILSHSTSIFLTVWVLLQTPLSIHSRKHLLGILCLVHLSRPAYNLNHSLKDSSAVVCFKPSSNSANSHAFLVKECWNCLITDVQKPFREVPGKQDSYHNKQERSTPYPPSQLEPFHLNSLPLLHLGVQEAAQFSPFQFTYQSTCITEYKFLFC